MLAIIMAGGRGSRLCRLEKPLALLHGAPMISYVIRAFSSYEVVVVTTDHTPFTANWCRARGTDVVRSVGKGYCEDLFHILHEFEEKSPLFTVTADLPMLTPALIARVRKTYESSGQEACSVWTPVSVYSRLGVPCPDSYDIRGTEAVAAGLNIIDGSIAHRPQSEYAYLSDEQDSLVNVNTPLEFEAVQRILDIGISQKNPSHVSDKP